MLYQWDEGGILCGNFILTDPLHYALNIDYNSNHNILDSVESIVKFMNDIDLGE